MVIHGWKRVCLIMKKCEVCGATSVETQVYSGRRFGMGLLCNRHQMQMSSHGKITDPSRYLKRNEIIVKGEYSELLVIKKSEKYVVLIDIDDIEMALLYKWYITSHGYVANKNRDKIIYLHHLIMGINGKKGSVYIDHIDRNKLNNRKSNLRISTNQQNSFNKGIARSNTGIIGVSFNKNRAKYESKIKVDYETFNLGRYGDLYSAIKARLEAEKAFFGDFAPQRHLFKKYGV